MLASQTNVHPPTPFLSHRTITQATSLLLSRFGLIVTGILTSVLNTRILGPASYGDFKFVQTIFLFVTNLFTFGLFHTGCRLLSLPENQGIKRPLTASILIVNTLLGGLLLLVLLPFSYLSDHIFHNQLGLLLRIFSPFAFLLLTKLCLENMLQGDNRIYDLSILQFAPRCLYLVTAAALAYFSALTLRAVLALDLTSTALIILTLVLLLKPHFPQTREYLSILWHQNKTYGFQVYLGILANVATGHLAVLSIAFFVDNTSLGYYTLALTLATPLSMVPNAIGTTLFKQFAASASIPPMVSWVTFGITLTALGIFLVSIKTVLFFLYSADFLPAAPLAYLIAIGCAFHGLGDYYNRFLGAHGKGKELRNGALLQGAWNLIGFTVLVHLAGVTGAAVARAISGAIYFSALFFYYQNVTARA